MNKGDVIEGPPLMSVAGGEPVLFTVTDVTNTITTDPAHVEKFTCRATYYGVYLATVSGVVTNEGDISWLE